MGAFPPLGRVPQNDLITFQLPHDDLFSGQPVQQHPAGGLAQLLGIHAVAAQGEKRGIEQLQRDLLKD